jgi:hypothetical protein
VAACRRPTGSGFAASSELDVAPAIDDGGGAEGRAGGGGKGGGGADGAADGAGAAARCVDTSFNVGVGPRDSSGGWFVTIVGEPVATAWTGGAGGEAGSAWGWSVGKSPTPGSASVCGASSVAAVATGTTLRDADRQAASAAHRHTIRPLPTFPLVVLWPVTGCYDGSERAASRDRSGSATMQAWFLPKQPRPCFSS